MKTTDTVRQSTYMKDAQLRRLAKDKIVEAMNNSSVADIRDILEQSRAEHGDRVFELTWNLDEIISAAAEFALEE